MTGSEGQDAETEGSARPAARLVWLGPADMVSRLPITALARALPGLPPVRGVEPVALSALEKRIASGRAPDAVLSPLFWDDGDVMETSRLLWTLDYLGPYRIISPPLPRPGMVTDEVLSVCPGLDVDLIPLPRR